MGVYNISVDEESSDSEDESNSSHYQTTGAETGATTEPQEYSSVQSAQQVTQQPIQRCLIAETGKTTEPQGYSSVQSAQQATQQPILGRIMKANEGYTTRTNLTLSQLTPPEAVSVMASAYRNSSSDFSLPEQPQSSSRQKGPDRSRYPNIQVLSKGSSKVQPQKHATSASSSQQYCHPNIQKEVPSFQSIRTTQCPRNLADTSLLGPTSRKRESMSNQTKATQQKQTSASARKGKGQRTPTKNSPGATGPSPAKQPKYSSPSKSLGGVLEAILKLKMSRTKGLFSSDTWSIQEPSSGCQRRTIPAWEFALLREKGTRKRTKTEVVAEVKKNVETSGVVKQSRASTSASKTGSSPSKRSCDLSVSADFLPVEQPQTSVPLLARILEPKKYCPAYLAYLFGEMFALKFADSRFNESKTQSLSSHSTHSLGTAEDSSSGTGRTEHHSTSVSVGMSETRSSVSEDSSVHPIQTPAPIGYCELSPSRSSFTPHIRNTSPSQAESSNKTMSSLRKRLNFSIARILDLSDKEKSNTSGCPLFRSQASDRSAAEQPQEQAEILAGLFDEMFELYHSEENTSRSNECPMQFLRAPSTLPVEQASPLNLSINISRPDETCHFSSDDPNRENEPVSHGEDEEVSERADVPTKQMHEGKASESGSRDIALDKAEIMAELSLQVDASMEWLRIIRDRDADLPLDLSVTAGRSAEQESIPVQCLTETFEKMFRYALENPSPDEPVFEDKPPDEDIADGSDN